MAKNPFFQNVWTAVKFLAPRVEADNPYTKPEEIERALRGATIWLTPKSVEGFEPEDFEDIPQQERQALATNVKAFREVGETVPANAPATAEQVQEALPRFLKIVVSVQKMMCDEWIEAASTLIDQARSWALTKEWPTKCYAKQISEDFLGTYELTKLVFAAEGSQLVLNPVGRFAPGADGMFDLAVLPDYESVMVVRKEERWQIHPLAKGDKRRMWSETAFIETAEKLARLA